MNSANIEVLLAGEAFSLQDDMASPPPANTGGLSTSRRWSSQTFWQNQAACRSVSLCLTVMLPQGAAAVVLTSAFNIWLKI